MDWFGLRNHRLTQKTNNSLLNRFMQKSGSMGSLLKNLLKFDTINPAAIFAANIVDLFVQLPR